MWHFRRAALKWHLKSLSSNTFFPSAHETFSRIDHMVHHEASFGKFKKSEIIPSIFSDGNPMRLDINYKKKTKKTQAHGG